MKLKFRQDNKFKHLNQLNLNLNRMNYQYSVNYYSGRNREDQEASQAQSLVNFSDEAADDDFASQI